MANNRYADLIELQHESHDGVVCKVVEFDMIFVTIPSLAKTVFEWKRHRYFSEKKLPDGWATPDLPLTPSVSPAVISQVLIN